MGFDERAQYVREAIAEVLDNDTDIFVDVCEQLDDWNGFLGDARCYNMDMIDEFFARPSDLLDRMMYMESQQQMTSMMYIVIQ